MKEKAAEYFGNGNSCSESIVKAASDKGLCDNSLISCATPFSRGMSAGCVCGAIAGCQLVIGYNYGKENVKNNPIFAREKSKLLVEEFKKRHKVTCCRSLTAGMDETARKEHCTKLVCDAADILEKLITKVKV